MMHMHSSVAVMLFITAALAADQTATTADGRKVLLRENGTWTYVPGGKTSGSDDATDSRTSLIEIIKNDRQFDFRNARWGMNKKQVMTSEKAKLRKNEPDRLEYEVQFLGYNCTVLYTFAGDALSSAAFLIGQEHVDPALFYKDYEDLKLYLAPQFGNPVADNCDWTNEMYRSDRSKWGFAVSLGFLTCTTRWNSVSSAITLSISGANHAISTRIEYAALSKR